MRSEARRGQRVWEKMGTRRDKKGRDWTGNRKKKIWKVGVGVTLLPMCYQERRRRRYKR